MSQQQSFWKKLFCVCTGEDSNDSKPKTRSIQPNVPIHYNQPKNIQRNMEDSNITVQLRWMNDSNHPLQLVVDNSQQCCFLVLKKQLIVPTNQNLQGHSQNQFCDHYANKRLLFDTQQNLIASPYVCKYIAGRMRDYQRILEVNSQFNQHTIQFLLHDMFVIALTSNQQHLQMGQHNLKELKKDSGYVSTIFGNLSTMRMDWKRMPVDAIFINLTNYKKDLREKTYKELCNAFRICQNVVVLLAGQKIDFLINLLARISYEQSEIFLSVAIECQEVIINQRTEFTIVYIGGCSDVKRNQLVEALKDRILISNKFYKDYSLPTILEPIFTDLIEKIGCVQLMKYFLESIYDLKSQSEFTNNFFRTLEKNELINRQILEDYTQRYPPILTPSMSPLRKPRKNTATQQQSISFNYDLPNKQTNTDFLLEGGTFFSNNATTQNDKIK